MQIGHESAQSPATPAATASSISSIPIIDTVEELERVMGKTNDQGEIEEEEGKEGAGKQPDDKKKPPVKATGDLTLPDLNDDGEEEEEEEGEGKEIKDYPSSIHYVNETLKLGLNLDDYKEGVPAEEEAEIFKDIIERVTANANTHLAEYKYIEDLLEDPEMKLVLEAKAAGKSLRDIAPQFIQTIDGKTNEQLVSEDLKKRYPQATDKFIETTITNLKTQNEFEPFAKSLREQILGENKETEKKQLEVAKEKQRLAQEEEVKNIATFTSRVKGLNNMFGVTLSDAMKNDVIKAVTKRDAKGETYMDRVLQSDEGLILASLGVLYMKDMITNASSVKANKRNKTFMDRIYANPKDLQSGSGQQQREEEEFKPELANRF